MKTRKILDKEKGFTLIGIALLVLAIGIIAFIAGALGVKLQSIARERDTVKRMTVIRNALKEYYRGHRDLPVPVSNQIPVGVSNLNIEQKYRLDTWGQYFHFNRTPNTGTTNIVGLTVDGKQVAGVIVSAGPNQEFNSFDPTNPPTTYPVGAWGDDIAVPINLQSEAIEIANKELHELAKKGCAYKCGPAGIWPPPPEIPNIISNFVLGDVFSNDPWLNPYLWETPATPSVFPRVYSSGPDKVTPSSDDIFVTVGGLGCCSPGPTPPIPGLVGFWNFSSAPGSGPGGVKDSSSSGNNGTNIGATWVSGSVSWPFPGALFFDGNDYVVIPSSDSLNLESDFTFAAWIMKPPSGYISPDPFTPRYQKVISRRDSYKFYFLGVDQEYPYGGVGNASGWNVTPRRGCDGLYTPQLGYEPPSDCVYPDPSYGTALSTWYHLAFVYDNNDSNGPGPLSKPHSMKIYINKLGDISVSLKHYGWTSYNPGGLSGINITIGADSNGIEHFFKGYISYVAVYNRALSQSEIQTLFGWR